MSVSIYKPVYLVFLILSLILPLSTILGESSQNNDTLIIQVKMDERHLDNRWLAYSSSIDELVGLQWQGRLVRNSPGETAAWYPTTVKNIKDISGNNTIYEFELKDGLTFHDESTITARDVKYSFVANLAVYGGLGVSSSPMYENLSEALTRIMLEFDFAFPADDPNGNGLIFTLGPGVENGSWLPKPDFFIQDLSKNNRFILVPEDSHGKYSDDRSRCEELIEVFAENPISCGPYKFVEHNSSNYISLERFSDWYGWGESITDNFDQDFAFPHFKNAFRYLKFQNIPNLKTILDQFNDFVGIIPTDGDYLLDVGIPGSRINSLTSSVLNLNIQGDFPEVFGGTGNYPFTEIWFRQVLYHAINRSDIVEDLKGRILDIYSKKRDRFYPNWIQDKYPGFNALNDYELDYDQSEAIEILERHGYTRGKFSGDEENRFGYGPYLNETTLDGVNQTRGHTFKMIIDSSSNYQEEVGLIIAQALGDLGIFVETFLLNRPAYLLAINEDFNRAHKYEYGHYLNGTKDPNYLGPEWDMYLGQIEYPNDSPGEFAEKSSFIWWYLFGGKGGILNDQYERELARMLGGGGYNILAQYFHVISNDSSIPYPSWIGLNLNNISPLEELPFPYPLWDPNDEQFVEAAIEAERLFSTEMLTYIPISWHQDTYLYQEYLQNFIPDAKGQFLCAYAFWNTPPIQIFNNVTIGLLVLVSIASWFIIRSIRKK